MSDIQIRRARQEDGPAIHEVVCDIHVKRIPEDLTGDRGFLMTCHSAEVYGERAAVADFSYVAEVDGEVGGFLTAYSRAIFAPWVEAKRSADPAYAYILDEGGEDVVLLDQIGVKRRYQHLRVGHRLYDEFAAAANGRPVMLDIVHAPVANERSRRFFTERNGFRLIREFDQPPLRFGVYRNDRV